MIKILALDDDLQVRDSLVHHLEDADFDVLEADSAESALELLKIETVSLAIVDLRLPGMDGIEFIKEARDRFPGLKFIIYTGSLNFHVPSDIGPPEIVSGTLFQKPLLDLDEMTDEIMRMLKV